MYFYIIHIKRHGRLKKTARRYIQSRLMVIDFSIDTGILQKVNQVDSGLFCLPFHDVDEQILVHAEDGHTEIGHGQVRQEEVGD